MHTKAHGCRCTGQDLTETDLWGGGGGGWAGVPSSRGLKWENKTYKLKRSISVRSIKLPLASAIFFL